MTTKAAIYLRVSTIEQATDGYGIDAQREKCHAMATVKGWDVTREFADEGISGSKDQNERPALAQLLDAACGGDVDAVIVAGLDRLGRKTILIIDLVTRLNNCGVEFVSCKESIDTSTPAGRFVLTIFAGLAELEKDNITERLTGGRNARGQVDGERGGRIPYGYKREKFINGGDKVRTRLLIDQDTAPTVKRIFAERISGMTLQAIADGLTDDNIPTPQDGQRWYPSSVKSVLVNQEAYAGGYRWQSKQRWPVILDRVE